MRALSAAVATFAVFAVIAATTPPPAQAATGTYGHVDFFEHPNSSGGQLRFMVTCSSSGCQNNVADLSKLTPGPCNKDWSNLLQGNYNDCFSSLSTSAIASVGFPSAHLCIRAYNDANYGGSSQLWIVDRGYSLPLTPVLWDNQISSIKIYNC